MPHAIELASLNPEQLEAVTWPGGPLLIFAGAGSGKTRVITCRVARLLAEGVPPARLLAVTFTNRAAREMRGRVEQMVGPRAQHLWLGTFHALCARLLRIEGAAIGIDPNFVVYDDEDQMGLVRAILKERNVDDKALQPRTVLSEISRAKERLQGPEGYAGRASGFVERWVAEIYPDYDRRLRNANALDFDDLLGCAVRLLEQRPDVREKYQERFLHVMVDEYQDVNFAQYKLAQTFAGKHRNLTIVGDDDQSIYAWRGADVALMLRFTTDYPDAKIVTLSRNYRSTRRILDAAYHVIRHNRSRAEKRLWTENREGAQVTLTEAGTEQDEAVTVVDAILKDVRLGRRTFGDFAILYRTNAQSRVFEEVFVTQRVPHEIVGGLRFYERREIKDMLAYMRLALNPRDDVSLRRALNVPARGIGEAATRRIAAFASEHGLSMLEALRTQELQAEFGRSRKTLAGIKGFVGAIDEAAQMAEAGPVTPVLKALLASSGYQEDLKGRRDDESIGRLENLQEMITATAAYDERAAQEGAGPSLGGYLEQVSLSADVDQYEADGGKVTLMTLHSSKGLEFPAVFLVGMEEGVFPHSRSLGSDAEIEEERRLCYVGMTRAREELHLLCAYRRAFRGMPAFNRRSRFLDDIPSGDLGSLHPQSIAPRPEREVRPERGGGYAVVDRRAASSRSQGPEWSPPFTMGARVRHAKFGIGVVVSCTPLSNDMEVTVAFPGATGVKRLVQSLAKLEAL
jgi:DNA helicase-2/ATP-dependent DNA helicase PcrA